MTALYRTDESGIGRPDTNINHTKQWFIFIEHSKKYLTAEQLNHLLFSAKELLKCQKLLTECNQNKDELNIILAHTQIQLDQIDKQNSELSLLYEPLQHNELHLQTQYKNLQTQHEILQTQYKSVTEELALVTKELTLVKNSRYWKLTQSLKKLSFLKLKR